MSGQFESVTAPSALAAISEHRRDQLALLVYERLDAHDDTMRLGVALENGLSWRAHLDYLGDLQRVARAVLARATVGETPRLTHQPSAPFKRFRRSPATEAVWRP